ASRRGPRLLGVDAQVAGAPHSPARGSGGRSRMLVAEDLGRRGGHAGVQPGESRLPHLSHRSVSAVQEGNPAQRGVRPAAVPPSPLVRPRAQAVLTARPAYATSQSPSATPALL